MTARVARPDCHRGTPWCELDTITIIDYCNYCPIPDWIPWFKISEGCFKVTCLNLGIMVYETMRQLMYLLSKH